MFILKILLLLAISSTVFANSWFQNSEQQGKTAFEQEKYSEAVKLFSDPYKRGVALYKDGQFAAAAEAFASADRPEISLDAQYNLGNSYFQQQEYEKAIQAYEQVLKVQPEHDDAKTNLELAKQKLEQDSEQKNSEQSEQENSEQSDQENSEQSDQENSEQSDQENSEQSDQENSEQSKQENSEQSENYQSEPQNEQSQEDQEDIDSKQSQAEENQEEAMASSETAMMKESDMMADALLDRIKENPQQLLRGQFNIDAYNSRQPPPAKPW